MSALTSQQLAALRRVVAQTRVVRWDKTTFNAALQAIEDWWESPQSRASVKGAINPVTRPFAFTDDEMKQLLLAWFASRVERKEG